MRKEKSSTRTGETRSRAGGERFATGPAPWRVTPPWEASPPWADLLPRSYPPPEIGLGRPLDATTRARMEPRLGHDLSNVRVHTDAPAAGAARALDAHAFTSGDDIVFGAGKYQPGHPLGDALLAHELAHVVQQSGSRAPATPTAGDVEAPELEARADRAALGVVRDLHAPRVPGFHARAASGLRGLAQAPRLQRCGGQQAVAKTAAAGKSVKPGAETPPAQAGAQPQAVAATGPSFYDTTQFTLTGKDPAVARKDLLDALAKKKDDGDITGWSTPAVKSGSVEELYLLYTIVSVARKTQWDSELDIVTEIGPGQQGAVTVRMDANGKATATLISKTAPAAPAIYSNTADAIAGLKAAFKLADVKGERGKSWKVEELNDVAAAWSRLAPAERAALAGFTLIRTDDALETPGGGPAAGLTTQGDSVAKGAETAVKVREIRFPDRAFPKTARSFVGDEANAAPSDFIPLLHEPAHAIAGERVAAARASEMGALAETNRAVHASNTSQVTALTAVNGSVHVWNRLKPAEKTPSRAAVQATKAAQQAILSYQQEPDPTKMPALRTAAQAAIAARDTANGAVPAGNPALGSLNTAAARQNDYLKVVDALLAKRRAQATASAATMATRDPTGMFSLRVQRFVDLVNKNGIRPITQYARDNWPAKPEEFFSEAFALWHSDPQFLGRAAPSLKAWFDAGEHLK